MLDAGSLKDLRGWDHVRKFSLGNIEFELALSILLLDAIVLGKTIEKRERDAELKEHQRSIREASARLRVP